MGYRTPPRVILFANFLKTKGFFETGKARLLGGLFYFGYSLY